MQKCMPKTFIWGPVGVQMPRRGAAFDAATPQVLNQAYISAKIYVSALSVPVVYDGYMI